MGQLAEQRRARWERNKANPDLGPRVCKQCGQEKQIAEFKKSWLGRGGYESKCKDCVRGRDARIKKKSRTIHWETGLAYGATQRSRERGLPCDVDAAYILALWERQRGMCYWFGVRMLPDAPNYHPQKPSIERLDRNKSYTKDNVVLACYAANMGRNDTDAAVFAEFVKELRKAMTPC